MNNPLDSDQVYGKYGLYNTFSVDQVPLPFASCDPRTIEFIGCKRVWIKQPGSGLDKRQCSLQLLIRPMGVQPKPCLIFRGAAKMNKRNQKQRTAEMKLHEANGVVAKWQRSAWADTDFSVEWGHDAFGTFVTETLGQGAETLVLSDSLGAQVSARFKTEMTTQGAHLVQGPKNGTYIWQPCDHHVGARYKYLMGLAYDNFMVHDFPTYAKGQLSASVRRVLLSKWAGAAWTQLEAERVEREEACKKDPTATPSLFFRAFQRTGCMVTSDGTLDEAIIPHRKFEGDLLAKSRAHIRLPAKAEAPRQDVWDGWIHFDETDDDDDPEGEAGDAEGFLRDGADEDGDDGKNCQETLL